MEFKKNPLIWNNIKQIEHCETQVLAFHVHIRQFPPVSRGFALFLTPEPWNCKSSALTTVFFSVLVPFQMGFTVLTPTHYQTCMDPAVGQTGIVAIIMTPVIVQSGLSEQ